MKHQFTHTLVRDPLKSESDDWQETAHRWHITINGQEFDYYTGLAHREARRMSIAGYKDLAPVSHRLTPDGFKKLLSYSMATPPKLDDVLYSLISDYEACEMSFAEWCSNFDYKEDSRKALDMYLACQKNGEKLRKAGIDIEKEHERLQDY